MTQTFGRTPGFGPMTRVSTNFGEVPAQALRERDLVRTYGGDYLPILWVDRVMLNEDFLVRHPDALPIEMQAGFLSQGLPKQPITLAPGQMISPEPASGPSVRQAAGTFLGGRGVVQRSEDIITYTRFHLGKAAYVCSEGMWVHVCPDQQQGYAA